MASDQGLRGGRLTAVGAGVLGLGALGYVALADPHRLGSPYPPCPFKLITGLNCPACGGLRMTHDLVYGDLGAAVVDNVFLLVGLPLLGLWSLGRWRQGRRVFTPSVIAVIVIAAIVWTIVRNLPGFPLVPTVLSPSS